MMMVAKLSIITCVLMPHKWKREKADKNLQNVYIEVYNYNARCREKIKTVSNSKGELNSLMIAGS
jgi:hypothetical protein